jgi:hypothetical protein
MENVIAVLKIRNFRMTHGRGGACQAGITPDYSFRGIQAKLFSKSPASTEPISLTWDLKR